MLKDMAHEQLIVELNDLPLFRKLALIEYLASIIPKQDARELNPTAAAAVTEYCKSVKDAALKCRGQIAS